VKITCTTAAGLVDFHPQHEGVDIVQHQLDRLGGDEADLVRLGGQPGGDTVDIMGLIEETEIAAEILRMLARGPQGSRMPELGLCIFFSQIDHERIKVAEGGAEDQCGSVQVDHRLHGLGAGIGLRDILFLDDLDPGHRLQRLGGDRMSLVPAEIVARPDIDDADGDVAGRPDQRWKGGGTGERAGTHLKEFSA
jgi:hypothetical protein